jgi:hypothetical protein
LFAKNFFLEILINIDINEYIIGSDDINEDTTDEEIDEL